MSGSGSRDRGSGGQRSFDGRLEALEARQGLVALLKYSLIVVASVPVMIMYPFVQRYFVKGVMIGSIKG